MLSRKHKCEGQGRVQVKINKHLNKRPNKNRSGLSLLELLAVVTLLGILVTIAVTRVSDETSGANVSGCYTYKGDIEIQAEIWMHNTGGRPAGNLADIAADSNYFPDGLPTCPVDGLPYEIESTTGRVNGHNH